MNTHCRIGKITPKPHQVLTIPNPVNHEAVFQAQRLLDRCSTGQYRSIGVCAIDSRGHVATFYSVAAYENPILMQGAVGWLERRISDKVEYGK